MPAWRVVGSSGETNENHPAGQGLEGPGEESDETPRSICLQQGSARSDLCFQTGSPGRRTAPLPWGTPALPGLWAPVTSPQEGCKFSNVRTELASSHTCLTLSAVD